MSLEKTRYSPLNQNSITTSNHPECAEINDTDIADEDCNHIEVEDYHDEPKSKREICKQFCLLIIPCALISVVVFIIWSLIYEKHIHVMAPINQELFPRLMIDRAEQYTKHLEIYNTSDASSIVLHLFDNITVNGSERSKPLKGFYIYSREEEKYRNATGPTKLICYYTAPNYEKLNETNDLLPKNIDPYLCTHINIGIVRIANCSLNIDSNLVEAFKEVDVLRKKNKDLKILLWVGGAGVDSNGFSEMVADHANRKVFIRSLKTILETFYLDGIDLDWEFPNGFNKERMHFSQLLHEIRREYQREHRTYLLSVAVTGIPTLIDMSYDIREINNYVDYVNVMTYDFHFYARSTPWTGLNAPLFKRTVEGGFFATLNINYSINYLIDKGIEKSKLIIGLPTYGHTYQLVNAFNTRIGAPASDFGHVGFQGFASYSDVCWFMKHNEVIDEFDEESCSPYVHSGNEWISYDNEKSLECKTKYIKDNQFGGAMIFSLNADDYQSSCSDKETNFPLLMKVHSTLFNQNETNPNST